MALSIMNNVASLGAINSVNRANTLLTNTIKQLSTGLRINSAADDASGLAVSEKLRGQISGLAKAAANAQDAISMLQTAEGAMGSMTDIVQRMRELAVQAGDPAYTTNDRAMLQLEVDQLKQEIDRISTSTEFNTKKLLNGDAAALWSATSDDIEAIIRGTPAEGNYEIETFVAGGTNNVYKTDIMTLNEGAQSATELREGNAAVGGVKSVTNIQGMAETSNTAGTTTGTPKTAALAIATAGAVAAAAVQKMGFYLNDSATGAASFNITAANVVFTAGTQSAAGTFEIEMLTDREADSTGLARIRFMNAENGTVSEWTEFRIGEGGGNSAAITIGNISLAAGSITMEADEKALTGDKVLLGYTAKLAAAASPAANITVNTGNTASTTATVANAGYTIRVDDAVDANNDKTHTLYTAQINSKTGDVYYGSMDVTLKKATAVTASAAPAVNATADNAVGIALNINGEGSVASKWTKLGDIARFTNDDGRNILDNTQELTIYGGNGKTATIYVEASDTIEDFENKLTSAIVDQLGLGTNNATVNENLVNYVKEGIPNSNEAVDGTFIIQTAMLGRDSSLAFSGDQGLIDALSLANIQEAEDPAVTIRVTDAHTGEFIGEDTVSDNILRGVIKGVDVKVNPTADGAVTVGWDADTKTITFTPSSTGSKEFLHIVDNSTKAAIGANEGQVLDISIAQLDTTSLEIDDVNVTTFYNSQKSITKLDQALERISKARATAGAQINRLDYTISNLNTTRENLVASESRIRDLDIAQASADLVARQVLLQSATAMLAQANQLPSYAAQLIG